MRSIPPTIVLAVLFSGALLAADTALPAPKPAPAASAASESAQSTPVYAEDGQIQVIPGQSAAPKSVAIDEAIQVFRQATEQQGLRGGPRAAKSAPSGLLWHGRVYEYLRNNALDATPHQIVQNGGDQNLLRRNQYGFSVSGPVILPKLYDGRRRTFFTLSWEATRENVGRSYLRTLPSLPQRSGDFADLVDSAGNPVAIYDPGSTFANPAYDPSQVVSESNLEYIRDPFVNNRIAETRLDSTAALAAESYPLPNTSIGPFLTNNFFSNPTATNRPSGFVARVDQTVLQRHQLTVDLARSRGFVGEPRIYDTVANPGRPDRNFLDQRIVVRDTFAVSPAVVYEVSLAAESSVVETEAAGESRNLPQELGLTGVSGSVFPMLRLEGFYGMGASRGQHLRNARNDYALRQSLSVRSGLHQLIFSGDVRRAQLNTLEQDAPSGDLRFNSALTGLPGITNTGSSYASFLLGMASAAAVTDQPQPSYLRQSRYDARVRDQIELSKALTATVSMRLDVVTPHIEKYDRRSTVDLAALNPANGLPGALAFANRDDYGRGFQPVRARLDSNVGLSWSPDSDRDTVLRASVGRYGNGMPLRSGAFGTQGFSAVRQPISPNVQLTPAVVLSDGFEPLEIPLPNLSPDAANDTDADVVLPTADQPMITTASVSIEQRLPAGLILRANGSVNKGANMLSSVAVAGLNRVPAEALEFRDQLNEESFRRLLRPYPQFQRLLGNNQFPIGKYRSESGSVSIEKRMTAGLSFDASYRFRRHYDDYSAGVQDVSNREAEWALNSGTRPHAVSLSYLYEIPVGKGKALLGSAGVLSKVLGGWSVSGFTSWRSGNPILLTPQFNNTGGIVPYLRVNEVAGVSPLVESPSAEQWFNPAAFSHPGDFELGNASRTYRGLMNPSWQNHDLAVSKRVTISSEQSLELQFQSFNFVNHANWNSPDARIGTVDAPNVNAGRIIGSTGGRVLQLGARYSF